MDISEIKKVSVVAYLRTLGYKHTRVSGKNLWYFSPFHFEKHPSFKVNTERNLWYDFSINRGGDIINFAKEMYPNLCIHDVLLLLGRHIKDYGLIDESMKETSRVYENSKDISTQQNKNEDDARNTKIIKVVPLRNYQLMKYLRERRINFSVARLYCKEVYYSLESTGKEYYGIAFPNVEDGMEMRNKFSKRCIGRKTYSYILDDGEKPSEECCVFEGFFDFLSYMTLKKCKDIGVCIENKSDYIILNSVNTRIKASEVFGKYKKIHCFLDNDYAGKDCTLSIIRDFPGITVDESYRYKGYKDLNDIITGIMQRN